VRDIEQQVVRTKVVPVSSDRFTMQVTLPAETHDLLRYAQSLLSHAVPNRNVPEVIHRALKALVGDLEKQKFGVGSKRSKAKIRGIPARVKCAVFERDGGRCTILLDDGKRCGSRDRIEFDHIMPRAKGGPSTADNLRLVCRAHNLWAAEQEFGLHFMAKKRKPK